MLRQVHRPSFPRLLRTRLEPMAPEGWNPPILPSLKRDRLFVTSWNHARRPEPWHRRSPDDVSRVGWTITYRCSLNQHHKLILFGRLARCDWYGISRSWTFRFGGG